MKYSFHGIERYKYYIRSYTPLPPRNIYVHARVKIVTIWMGVGSCVFSAHLFSKICILRITDVFVIDVTRFRSEFPLSVPLSCYL